MLKVFKIDVFFDFNNLLRKFFWNMDINLVFKNRSSFVRVGIIWDMNAEGKFFLYTINEGKEEVLVRRCSAIVSK